MKRVPVVSLLLLAMVAGAVAAAPAPQPQSPAAPTVQRDDVQALVKQWLSAHGPVPVTHQVTVYVPITHCTTPPVVRHGPTHPLCWPAKQAVQQSQTTQDILSASNIRITKSSEMGFGELVQTNLPDELAAASLEVCNPNQTTGSQTASFSQQIQHNESATVTHSITNTLSDSIGATFNISKVLKLSNTLQIGTSDTTATATLTGSALTQQLTVGVTQQIPAQSRYALEFLITPTQFTVPFSITVTIDANLSQNDEGLTLLSQIVDEPTRTFTIDGTLTSVVGLAASSNFVQLQFDSQHCPPSRTMTTKPLVLEPNQELFVKQ